MHVLIVDDEDSLLMTLAANLELEGFEVSCADDGRAALELIARQPFDLVLTDVRMPGMNGVDLFRRIRLVDRELPVLLMTAFAVETLIQEAIDEGIFAVLPKPFEIEHVIAAVLRASRRPAVLLVDDEGGSRAVASAASSMGVKCRVAHNPVDVLSIVREGGADVCVVDVASAAAQEGRLVAQILEADGAIAVIAVASDAAASLLRKAAAAGAFACLRKPFHVSELLALVARARSAFRVRERGRAVSAHAGECTR